MRVQSFAVMGALLIVSGTFLSLATAADKEAKVAKSGELPSREVKPPQAQGKLDVAARNLATGYVYVNSNGGFLLADKSRGTFELDGSFYAANSFKYLGSDGVYWHEQMVGWNAEFAFQISPIAGTSQYAVWYRLTTGTNTGWQRLGNATRGAANGDHN